MIMRVLRDLWQRTPTWNPLSQWVSKLYILLSIWHIHSNIHSNMNYTHSIQALELLVEKIISSAGMPLSPGDCMRRVMEALSTGILINGPGVLDPCEKEPHDALTGLSKQQREDLTVSAQQFLRLIAFRQIHKVNCVQSLKSNKILFEMKI